MPCSGDLSFMELVLRSAAVSGWLQLLEVGANLGDCALWTAAQLGRPGRPWSFGWEQSEEFDFCSISKAPIMGLKEIRLL